MTSLIVWMSSRTVFIPPSIASRRSMILILNSASLMQTPPSTEHQMLVSRSRTVPPPSSARRVPARRPRSEASAGPLAARRSPRSPPSRSSRCAPPARPDRPVATRRSVPSCPPSLACSRDTAMSLAWSPRNGQDVVPLPLPHGEPVEAVPQGDSPVVEDKPTRNLCKRGICESELVGFAQTICALLLSIRTDIKDRISMVTLCGDIAQARLLEEPTQQGWRPL